MDVIKTKVYILDIQVGTRVQMFKWLRENKKVAKVKVFDCHINLIEQVGQSPPHYCIIRLGQNEIPGLKAAGMIQQINSKIRIVFIADERDYVLDAYEIGAHAYLLSPLNKKQFEKCFYN